MKQLNRTARQVTLLLVLFVTRIACQQQQPTVLGNGLFATLLSPFQATLEGAQQMLASDEQAASMWDQRLDKLQAQTFSIFARIYNKTYSVQELPRRMALFFERRREIEESVRAYAEGRLPFMMRENAFADWDEHELRTLTGVAPPRSPTELLPEERQALEEATQVRQKRSMNENGTQTEEEEPVDLIVKAVERIPATKDWRSSGCVSTPINQMKCGACYAIASMSVIETMRCLRTVSSPILSPQHIVDCATPASGYQNFGCNGGWPTRVFRYLQDTGAAVQNSCYPFVRRQQQCRIGQLWADAPSCLVNASPTDTRLTYKLLNNERDILYHVARTGPVVTVMRTTNRFLYYGSGIFDDPTCSRRRDDVDHAVVIVGYGRENGKDYWLIKNSWGTREWGQMGYGKYRRGTNACSIGHWGWVVTS